MYTLGTRNHIILIIIPVILLSPGNCSSQAFKNNEISGSSFTAFIVSFSQHTH